MRTIIFYTSPRRQLQEQPGTSGWLQPGCISRGIHEFRSGLDRAWAAVSGLAAIESSSARLRIRLGGAPEPEAAEAPETAAPVPETPEAPKASEAALVGLGLPYPLRVLVEEAMMIGRFGDAYRDYMKRAGQLWPVRSEPPAVVSPPRPATRGFAKGSKR